jgi:hypothetical protein
MLDLGLAGQGGLGLGDANPGFSQTNEAPLDGARNSGLLGAGHNLELRKCGAKLVLGGIDGGLAVGKDLERAGDGVGA